MSDFVVRVRYFNVLAIYAGTRQAEVRVVPGTTVGAVLEHLIATAPDALRAALVRGDNVSTYLRVFRNEILLAKSDFDQPLAAGDELMLFPAVAGG